MSIPTKFTLKMCLCFVLSYSKMSLFYVFWSSVSPFQSYFAFWVKTYSFLNCQTFICKEPLIYKDWFSFRKNWLVGPECQCTQIIWINVTKRMIFLKSVIHPVKRQHTHARTHARTHAHTHAHTHTHTTMQQTETWHTKDQNRSRNIYCDNKTRLREEKRDKEK